MKDLTKILIFTLVVILYSCSGGNENVPDVSGSQVNVKFNHFYRFFPGDPGYFKNDSVPLYYKKFPRFFDIFCRYVISIGGPEKKDFFLLTDAFCNDPMIRGTFNDCKKVHGDLKPAEEEIQKAFSYYHYYFPEKQIPEVFFFQSGFNQSVVVDSALLGIAIDKYMGEGYELYAKLGLPHYQCRRMVPVMMVPDAMRAWLESEFPMKDSSVTLLNSMIYNGKIQFLLRKMFPYEEDTLLFAFTGPQWEWCSKNENRMWAWYIENKKLFETDPLEIKRFTDDGPFTTQFSKESPARTGVWTGWRIVDLYMEKNPELSPADLMKTGDAQKILSGSGYNP